MTATPEQAGALRLQRCEALDPESVAPGLFMPDTNGRPLASVYSMTSRPGAVSWLGLDDADHPVMHVCVVPRRFRLPDGSGLTGGLLGDLVVAPGMRNFWMPLKFFRQIVSELTDNRELDFLYSDPTPQAVGLSRAGGFRLLGNLQRFVLPAGRPYGWLMQLRRMARVEQRLSWAVADPNRVDSVLAALPPSRGFGPLRTAEDFRRGGELSAGDRRREMAVLTESATPGSPLALVAVEVDSRRRSIHLLKAAWDEGRVSIGGVLIGIAAEARRRGLTKVGVSLLADSHLATDAVAYGAIRRVDRLPVVVKELRASLTLPDAADWALFHADGSAW